MGWVDRFKRKSRKVVIIGLDGVPYRLIKALAENGTMPNVKGLIEEGAFRQMESSIPEISSVAWSSIITGTNPGVYGVFGFTDLAPRTDRTFFPNSCSGPIAGQGSQPLAGNDESYWQGGQSKMIESLSVYTIIPARGGSTRLPRKNIYPVWGQPMLYWAIQACKASQYIDKYFVSTEDAEITDIAKSLGAEVIDRPKSLADDLTFKQDVIVHAASVIPEKPDLVVSLQPSSPQVCAQDLDAAIDKLVTNERNEIFSVNEELLQNAAFRIMKYEYVFQKSISTTSGVYVTDYVDVHTKEDVEYLEKFDKPCEHYREAEDA